MAQVTVGEGDHTKGKGKKGIYSGKVILTNNRMNKEMEGLIL